MEEQMIKTLSGDLLNNSSNVKNFRVESNYIADLKQSDMESGYKTIDDIDFQFDFDYQYDGQLINNVTLGFSGTIGFKILVQDSNGDGYITPKEVNVDYSDFNYDQVDVEFFVDGNSIGKISDNNVKKALSEKILSKYVEIDVSYS